jgi:hypothetical protein
MSNFSFITVTTVGRAIHLYVFSSLMESWSLGFILSAGILEVAKF